MKWWAFNQEQLDAALPAFLARYVPDGVVSHEDPIVKAAIERDVRAFLCSPEALQHKMRGDQ